MLKFILFFQLSVDHLLCLKSWMSELLYIHILSQKHTSDWWLSVPWGVNAMAWSALRQTPGATTDTSGALQSCVKSWSYSGQNEGRRGVSLAWFLGCCFHLFPPWGSQLHLTSSFCMSSYCEKWVSVFFNDHCCVGRSGEYQYRTLVKVWFKPEQCREGLPVTRTESYLPVWLLWVAF